MKVSKFFRYFFSILSILAVLLGIMYFALYYNCKDFHDEWKRYNDWVMNVSEASVLITEIANVIFAVTKAHVQIPKRLHIKSYAEISIPLLLVASLCAFILGRNAFYMQIVFLLFDVIFFIGGDMIDYDDVVDVDTIIYEGDYEEFI